MATAAAPDLGISTFVSSLLDVDAVRAEAFALAEDIPGAFESDVHQHNNKHQLLYARSGTMFVVTGSERWMLPPQRAAFIPAGTKHAVSSTTGIELRTVYFDRGLIVAAKNAAVFEAPEIARAMILHAMRWTASTRNSSSSVRTAFFRALAELAAEWIAAPVPLSLPRARSEDLRRAMEHAETHLAEATAESAAKAAGMSVRTLSRRFDEELGITFRAYLQTARILRAMELLARPRASVSATAYAVGFQSAAAFATAFAARCGESPTAFRARCAK